MMHSTLEKLRFLGKCFAIGLPMLWLAWFLPFDDLVDRSGAALGGDYVMLYAAGQTVASGDSASLYDDALNQQRTNALVPGMDPSSSWPFRYPPFTALAMVPLTWLPFGWSFAAFFCCSVAALALALWLLVRPLPLNAELKWAIVWAAIGWPVVLEVLIGGQTTLMAMGILAGAIALARSGREITAGAVLALALYKPNILGLFAIGFFVKYPRAVIGGSITAVILMGVSWLVVGWDGLAEYARLATSLSTSEWGLETPYWKVHGLQAWFAALVGENARPLTTGVGVTLVMVVSGFARFGRLDTSRWLAVLLGINALFNPYTPIYDLALLLPAVLLMLTSLSSLEVAKRPSLVTLVACLLFFGPHLSQAVSKSLHTELQLFSVVLAGLLIVPFLVPTAREQSMPEQRCGV